MSEPKKQHYVPQVYLNRFTYSTAEPSKIHVLHKSQNKIYPANISDTAAERHFYTIGNGENKYIWEKRYAEIVEPMLSRVLTSICSSCENVLIQNGAAVLTAEIQKQLAISMIFQLFRGKQCRNFSRQVYDDEAPVIIEEIKQKHMVDQLLDNFMEEKYLKSILVDLCFDKERMNQYANMLLIRSFVLYKIIGEAEFVTSDNPVMFLDADTHRVTPFTNGLLTPTTIVYYPLSPKLLIKAYHPDYYLGAFNHMDGKIYLLDAEKNKAFIDYTNAKQLEQCHDKCFAKTKSVLENCRCKA